MKSNFGGLHGEIDALMISEEGLSLYEKEIPTSLCVCSCSNEVDELTKARIRSLYEEKERNDSHSIPGIRNKLRHYLQRYEELRRSQISEEEIDEIYEGLTQGHTRLHAVID